MPHTRFTKKFQDEPWAFRRLSAMGEERCEPSIGEDRPKVVVQEQIGIALGKGRASNGCG